MQIRQLAFQYSPDQTMVDFGVSVDQDVPEGNDAAMFADSSDCVGIDSGKLVERFANDFKLAFDGRAQQRVGSEIDKRFAVGEL